MFTVGYGGINRVERGYSGMVGTEMCNKMCIDSQRDFYRPAERILAQNMPHHEL
jgi:hypothetical protein